MHAHGALRDRETEPGAAATLAIASVLGAIERTKDPLERIFGHTVATISHADHSEIVAAAILLSQRHFNSRSFRRVAHRITHHILHRTAQQLFNAINRTIVT